jgi:hypothetical protein
MFDGIPERWEKKPHRRPDQRDPWPLHAIVTIVVLTLAVYGLRALTLVM